MRPIKYGLDSYPEQVYMWLCLRPAAPGADFGGLKLIARFFRIFLKKKKFNFLSRCLKFLWEASWVYDRSQKKQSDEYNEWFSV